MVVSPNKEDGKVNEEDIDLYNIIIFYFIKLFMKEILQ